MNMGFEAAGQDLLVTGAVVVVAFTFLETAGKLPVFFIAGVAMGMFILAAGEVSVFIKAGFIVLMFRSLTGQLFRDRIAVICMVMAIGLLQPADELFFVALCRVLVGRDAAFCFGLHRDRRQNQGIGGDKYHYCRGGRNTAIPDFSKTSVFKKLADFFY